MALNVLPQRVKVKPVPLEEMYQNGTFIKQMKMLSDFFGVLER